MNKNIRNSPPHPVQQDTRAGLFDAPQAVDLASQIKWWDEATLAVWRLIESGSQFDAYAITEAVGRPYPGDARRVAQFMFKHSETGAIRRVGFRPTRSHSSNAIVSIWQPTEEGRRAAAVVLRDEQREQSA